VNRSTSQPADVASAAVNGTRYQMAWISFGRWRSRAMAAVGGEARASGQGGDQWDPAASPAPARSPGGQSGARARADEDGGDERADDLAAVMDAAPRVHRRTLRAGLGRAGSRI
jgi:hypothetical protein